MIKTLKDYAEEIALLPNAVKAALGFVLLVAVFGVYWGVSNFIADAKIQRLESQNFELNRQTQAALEKAAKAETNAANEAIRAQSLESQITALQEKTQKSDEKIFIQSQKSTNLRDDLRRIRTSSPANTSTVELEQRLNARYRKTKRPE